MKLIREKETVVPLGDGIRRNIAHIEPSERALLRDALLELNRRFFAGTRGDTPFPGGVSWWFKQDEIHQATHVHSFSPGDNPEFIPWHREIVNRLEALLREVNPQLSLHYWNWTEDPRSILNANLGGGTTGTLNLFTPDFMGYGGPTSQPIGPPWQNASAPWRSDGFYIPDAANYRSEDPFDTSHRNPADPPRNVPRNVSGAPETQAHDDATIGAPDYAAMSVQLETSHNAMHGFVNMGGAHTSFRDPFVFLLHSNVDRLFAMWQTQPGQSARLNPATVYTSGGVTPAAMDTTLEPWSGAPASVRPWAPPELEGFPKTYKHPSVVRPPCYDTLPTYPASVTLETPSMTFNDVPVGETAARAIVFSGVSCHDLNLSITAGPTVLTGPPATNFGTFPTPLGTAVTIHTVSSSAPPRGRLWISYRGTGVGDAATGTVTVHCAETIQDFVVPITANTIARPTVAAMLVLDQSGSMDWIAGIDPTTKRMDVLHQAATQFAQLAQDSSRIGDGVGVVSFDHTAHPGVGVTKNLGTGFDLAPVVTAISALHPAGATSIGNGLALGRDTLNPVTGYDHKALVVFTDGLENTSLYISDVLGTINDQTRTFAIGMGTAQQVSASALTALAHNTGGRVLLSGRLSPSIDDYFRLSKFFVQVLAGVQNSNIVTDPSGYLSPGMKVRIPFTLSETDIDSTVILLSDFPAIRFLIETPVGDLMDPARAAALGATYAAGTDMSYYRFTLPLPLGADPAHSGTWYAVLDLDEEIFDRLAKNSERTPVPEAVRRTHGIRYNVSAQTFSNLRMDASLSQNSLQPGATLTIRVSLSEYGIPVEGRASVITEVQRPDGSSTVLALVELEAGTFEASLQAGIAGVYNFRVLASGATLRGLVFTREQLLSGAVVRGGDNPPATTEPSTATHDKQLCDLIECLLRPEAIGRFFGEHQIDVASVQRCIEQWCKERHGGLSEQEINQREGIPPA